MFKFKASYVALAAVLTSSVVYADPTSYTHSSGATVIDIEKPNAAGVSHNLYRDFNVGTNGTILNNSGDDVSHSTFGNIARNNNGIDIMFLRAGQQPVEKRLMFGGATFAVKILPKVPVRGVKDAHSCSLEKKRKRHYIPVILQVAYALATSSHLVTCTCGE